MTNEKVTLQDLANILSEKQGISIKDAERFVKGMFDLIEDALITEKHIKIKGWGIFKLIDVDSRESIDVNTGERIEIQGHSKISFTPESSLKEQINKPFSHFETVILNEETVFDDMPSETEETEELHGSIEEPAPEVTVQENRIESTVQPEVIIPTEKDTIEAPEETEVAKESKVEIVEEKKEETIDKPIEEPSIEPSAPKELPIEKEKTSKGLILFTILLIVIILIGGYWLFFSPQSDHQLQPNEEAISMPHHQETKVVIEDSISQPSSPKEAEQETVKKNSSDELKETIPTPVVKKGAVASLADTTEYRITGTQTTHILQNGETIIRVSLKYFGDKNFWPYIAKHNEKNLKDPNNVPIGTKLLIPKLSPKN